MSATIPIPAVQPYNMFIAAAAQTVFDATWTASVASTVQVYARASGAMPNDQTQFVSPSLYNVTFVGSEQYVRVTFLTGRTLDDVIVLTRNTPIDRLNLYINTNFTPSMLNSDFGNDTFMIQEGQLHTVLSPHYNLTAITTVVDQYLQVLGPNQMWVKNADNTLIEAVDFPGSGVAPKDLSYITKNNDTAILTNSSQLVGDTNTILVTYASNQATVSIRNNPLIGGTSGMNIPTGTSDQRIVPTSGISFRFNTTLGQLEYYASGDWQQLDDSGDIEFVFSALASHTPGAGASLIGLEVPSDATVQDLADLPFLVTTDSTDVAPNSIIFNPSDYLLESGGTMTGPLILWTNTPATDLEAASKGYVDAVARGLNIQGSCYAATTTNLTATYSNGTAGVGATLTNSTTQAIFAIDGVSPPVNSRILFKNQSSSFQNGIYTLTDVGSVSTNWVATRATDFDEPDEIQPGDFVVVLNGTTQTNSGWLQTNTVTTIGTDPITFIAFSASFPVSVVHGGTGLTSTTINRILYSSANNVISEISTLANAVLKTDGSGVPGFSSTLSNLYFNHDDFNYLRFQGTSLDLQNGDFNGILIRLDAGEALTTQQLVYINASGKMQKADADGSGTFPAVFLAAASISNNANGNFLMQGVACNTAWTWTPGGTLYMSTTAGTMTQTAPATSGNIVQVVGYAITATIIYFDPSRTYLTVT